MWYEYNVDFSTEACCFPPDLTICLEAAAPSLYQKRYPSRHQRFQCPVTEQWTVAADKVPGVAAEWPGERGRFETICKELSRLSVTVSSGDGNCPI